jgi:tetratricopeptide (TPR) repeat protein
MRGSILFGAIEGSFRRSLLAAVLLALSGSAFGHGDLHEQITGLSTQIAAAPGKADLYLQRGEVYRLHEDWDLALADYDRAEKLDPNNGVVVYARSRLFLAREQFARAEKEAAAFLEKYPRHAGALIVQAHACAGQKQFLRAAEIWQRVIEAVPAPDVEHYYEQAQAFAAAGPEHIDDALAAIDAGLKKLGPLPTLALLAVDLETQRKHFEAALVRLDRAMPKEGRKELWLERRGDLLAGAGRLAESRDEYRKALVELEALPERLRATPATGALKERLEQKLK